MKMTPTSLAKEVEGFLLLLKRSFVVTCRMKSSSAHLRSSKEAEAEALHAFFPHDSFSFFFFWRGQRLLVLFMNTGQGEEAAGREKEKTRTLVRRFQTGRNALDFETFSLLPFLSTQTRRH